MYRFGSEDSFNVVTDETLNSFFEVSQDLLCIAGFDGYFKRVNPKVSQTLGYTLDELYSQPINSFIHPDDKNITNTKRNALHRSVPLLHFENRYLTKYGETVWLSWTSIPDESRKLVFAIAKDITYNKRMEEDRNNQLTYLTKLVSQLRKGIYMTSHDLRSPVGSVLFAASMLQNEPIASEDTRELITILKSSADSLSRMLNDYVDNLLDSDVFNIETTEVNFSEVLHFVKRSMAQIISSSQAVIHTDFSECPSVLFNRAFMESILLNLISNSIKYKKSLSKPVIYISTHVVDGKKILKIRDEGMGFDKEKMGESLFGIKKHIPSTLNSKGIGLYLVHSHISSMGGTIELESEPGKGATFIITFK